MTKTGISGLHLAVLLLSACGDSAPVAGDREALRQFRLFSVAYRHEVDRVISYQTYRDSVRSQFLAGIQPRLRGDRPNLVTYPENQTLMAYLIGSRGAASRETLASGESQSSAAAIASMAGPYKPQLDYYAAKFPGVDSPGQLLQLALTDTLARVVLETFGALAGEFNVYIAISGNLAPFERVEDARAATLADPEADTSYAYEATAPDVFNRNFIFGPDGQLITIQDKAYLVPIERTRDVGLGLTGIEVHQLPVFDLPFVRIGTVISKDAWMPDVNDRYDQLGAELLIQSEAFSTWGLAGDDLWPPDKFQRGGWWMVQKHPSLRVNVTPMLTGNFGDLTFDGQPLIAVKAPAGQPGLCLLGQHPEPGWAAVGAWANYTEPAAAFCAPARRDEFRGVAEKLKPGSGDVLENAYAEDVVFADLSLPARATLAPRVPRGAFGASVPIAGDAAQLQPSLAVDGGGVWLSWVDARRGRNQSVFITRSANGLTWTEPQAVDPQPVTDFDHFDNQWSPAVLADSAGVLLAYLGFPTENWDVFAVRVDANGTAGSAVRLDDAESESGVLRERGHSSPVLMRAADGALLAVWSDLRWPWVKPQIRVARSTDGGASWSASTRADNGALTAEEDQHNARDPGESRGQAFPAVAVGVNGIVAVAWQELSPEGIPAIYLSRSFDHGGHFNDVQRVSDLAAAWRPALLAHQGLLWLSYEQETGIQGRQLMTRLSPNSGESFGRPATLDETAAEGAVQRNASWVGIGNGVLAVFEDQRAGDSDILAVSISAEGERNAPLRVDDGPLGAEAFAPVVALMPDQKVLVVWQDRREGSDRLRSVVGQPFASVRNGGGLTVGPWNAVLMLALLMAILRWRKGLGPAGLDQFAERKFTTQPTRSFL